MEVHQLVLEAKEREEAERLKRDAMVERLAEGHPLRTVAMRLRIVEQLGSEPVSHVSAMLSQSLIENVADDETPPQAGNRVVADLRRGGRGDSIGLATELLHGLESTGVDSEDRLSREQIERILLADRRWRVVDSRLTPGAVVRMRGGTANFEVAEAPGFGVVVDFYESRKRGLQRATYGPVTDDLRVRFLYGQTAPLSTAN